MKHLCKCLRGFHCKLQIMDIMCKRPYFIYGDNQSVLCNTTIPESTLKKKSKSIACHLVREGVVRNEWRTAYVNTNNNEANLLTKLLLFGEKRKTFVRRVLHHIFTSDEYSGRRE